MKTITTQSILWCLLGGLAFCGCQKKSTPEQDLQTMEQQQRVLPENKMEGKERDEARDPTIEEETAALEKDLERLENRMGTIMNSIEDEVAQGYETSLETMKNTQKRARKQIEQTKKNLENQSDEVRESMKSATRNSLDELQEAIDSLQRQLETGQK
jgi:ElaB/YqjD/DUF883 family membrane-anchored ribosome-binding protein